MKKLSIFLILFLLLILFYSISLAQVPLSFNYQGVLRNNAGDLLSGTYDMTFSIYPSPEGGTAPWSEMHPAVEVVNGLYSVRLGDAKPAPTPVDPDIFDGQTKYLGVKIANDPEMKPRVALVSVPYALKAGGVVGGNFVYFEPKDVQETQTDRGLWVKSTASTGVGVWGESIENIGVHGTSSKGAAVVGVSETGDGVRGESGGGAGIYGRSDRREEEAVNNEIAGVVGSGEGIGVFGHAKNRGVKGIGNAFGVYGESKSTTGIGVYGNAPKYGVYGIGNVGVGGRGTVGGSFEATGSSGIGIYAKTTGSSGFSGYFEGGKGLFLDSDGKASATITLEKNSQQPDDPALDNSRIFIWKNYIVIQYTDGITGKTHYLYADLTSSGNWLHKGQLP